eukprot:scaffold73317_cov56-Phaeocystis_antarctica.AAC.4
MSRPTPLMSTCERRVVVEPLRARHACPREARTFWGSSPLWHTHRPRGQRRGRPGAHGEGDVGRGEGVVALRHVEVRRLRPRRQRALATQRRAGLGRATEQLQPCGGAARLAQQRPRGAKVVAALVRRAARLADAARHRHRLHVERVPRHRARELPDGRGGGKQQVASRMGAEAAMAPSTTSGYFIRNQPASMPPSGGIDSGAWIACPAVCVWGSRAAPRPPGFGMAASHMSHQTPRRGRARLGEAALAVRAAQRRVREWLVTVLGEHEQRALGACVVGLWVRGSGWGKEEQHTEPLSDLPHEPRVVDVLVDRRLVASVEEDGPRRVGRRAEAAARAAARPPPLVIKAETLRERAGCITEVVDLLREVLPRAVHDGWPARGHLGLPPATNEPRGRRRSGGESQHPGDGHGPASVVGHAGDRSDTSLG